ncbi:MAG: M23 family metallopeptidase [Bacteroidetes bacterium]|nr:MAG: M23 family metallopeptidase [Bacteroidota bacterium]
MIMRNYLASIAVLTVGAFLLLSQSSSPSVAAGTSKQAQIEQAQALLPALKAQQAHLRTIDPFDIDIVPSSRPVPEGYPLGSMFGMRKHPILGVNKMHQGIDFPAPKGTPVLATATGRVRKLITEGDSSTYGTHIMLEHDELYCTVYAHLSGVTVVPGQIVEEGDTIGFVGSTGRSTNPHLHYEVIRDGEPVDPEDYF